MAESGITGCNVGVLLKHASEAPAAIRQEDPRRPRGPPTTTVSGAQSVRCVRVRVVLWLRPDLVLGVSWTGEGSRMVKSIQLCVCICHGNKPAWFIQHHHPQEDPVQHPEHPITIYNQCTSMKRTGAVTPGLKRTIRLFPFGENTPNRPRMISYKANPKSAPNQPQSQPQAKPRFILPAVLPAQHAHPSRSFSMWMLIGS